MKKQVTKEMFVTHASEKRLISKIYKEFLEITEIQAAKMKTGLCLDRWFTKREIQLANEFWKSIQSY